MKLVYTPLLCVPHLCAQSNRGSKIGLNVPTTVVCELGGSRGHNQTYRSFVIGKMCTSLSSAGLGTFATHIRANRDGLSLPTTTSSCSHKAQSPTLQEYRMDVAPHSFPNGFRGVLGGAATTRPVSMNRITTAFFGRLKPKRIPSGMSVSSIPARVPMISSKVQWELSSSRIDTSLSPKETRLAFATLPRNRDSSGRSVRLNWDPIHPLLPRQGPLVLTMAHVGLLWEQESAQ